MKLLLYFFFLLLWLPLMTFATGSRVPVKYGGDENFDACSTLGLVSNIGDGQEEFLAVKAGPSLKSQRIDKIFKGQSLWICDEKKDWYGVVYRKDQKQDCAVTSPLGKRQTYRGPCKSGWVHKKYVEPVAG